VEAHYQTTIFDMKSNLEERIKRADDVSKAYKHFRLEVSTAGAAPAPGAAAVVCAALCRLLGNDPPCACFVYMTRR